MKSKSATRDFVHSVLDIGAKNSRSCNAESRFAWKGKGNDCNELEVTRLSSRRNSQTFHSFISKRRRWRNFNQISLLCKYNLKKQSSNGAAKCLVCSRQQKLWRSHRKADWTTKFVPNKAFRDTSSSNWVGRANDRVQTAVWTISRSQRGLDIGATGIFRGSMAKNYKF